VSGVDKEDGMLAGLGYFQAGLEFLDFKGFLLDRVRLGGYRANLAAA
jgi:hypothetical protein